MLSKNQLTDDKVTIDVSCYMARDLGKKNDIKCFVPVSITVKRIADCKCGAGRFSTGSIDPTR